HDREQLGDVAGSEAVLHTAVESGLLHAVVPLADLWTRTGEQEKAEALLSGAVREGSARAMVALARKRMEAGDHAAAESLFRRAVDTGQPLLGWSPEERWPYGLDPDGTPTAPW
ncbi:hypothetical protein ACFCXG_38410, partial [Streptomyces sp. NPDC056295]